MYLNIAWDQLFPTKISFIIFITYMGLFINQGILVTATKSKDNVYSYNTVTVVLFTECLKFIVAIGIFVKEHSCSEFFKEVVKHKKLLAYYCVPAALYSLYNNLAFVNLAAYDPTTYYLLLQFRVVVTGVVFQILFRKKLSGIQWLSLIILTAGCVIKEIHNDVPSGPTSSTAQYFDRHLLLILVQVFCSCFAGVYTEYLLKEKGSDAHIMIQNVYMYVNSIICNLLVLTYRGEIVDAFTPKSLASVLHLGVIAIIANNAAIGIIVSLFLKSLNSILKTFASALELMATAVLCWIIFGFPIDIYTLVAILVVTAATMLYAQNPVVNLPKDMTVIDSNENEEKTVQV